ncbi:hypothetical protein D3C83_30590 [compost metagenome]
MEHQKNVVEPRLVNALEHRRIERAQVDAADFRAERRRDGHGFEFGLAAAVR